MSVSTVLRRAVLSILTAALVACQAIAPSTPTLVAPWAVAPQSKPRLLEGFEVRMRDGVVLKGDAFLPEAGGRYPVILELTPYGRGDADITYRGDAPYWTSRGYAFVLVDTRGQGDSQGVFEFMRDGEDAYDLIEWLAVQPWSTGSVAMYGSSYTGSDQWFAARERPPALKCLTPAAVWHDPFAMTPYPGGAFLSGHAMQWPAILSDSGIAPGSPVDWSVLLRHRPLATLDQAAYGKPVRIYQQWIAHDRADEYWKSRTLSPSDFARIDIPTLGFTGTFDEMHTGTVANFVAARRHSPRPEHHFLVMGPWEHATVVDGGYESRAGYRPARQLRKLDLPDVAFLDSKDVYARFFDWCLRGGPPFKQAAARVYVTGSNRWLDLDEYPTSAAIDVPLYLDSGGAANSVRGDGLLRLGKAAPGEGADHYSFDPLDPGPLPLTAAPLRAQSDRPGFPVLERQLERNDVLVYTSAVLKMPLTVVGNVRLELHAVSDAQDTDWVARLQDIAPDGTAVELGVGPGAIVRARYRNGFDREVLIEPGKTYVYTLDFNQIAHAFRPGHRVRLSISSASYPWVHPNANTGRPIATDSGPPRVARQTVRHGALAPSRLLLPVLK